MSEREVQLTTEMYLNWLNAGRPDWQWFMAQDPSVQEQLAELGTQHRAEEIGAMARAILDNEGFRAEMFGTEEDIEEARIRRLSAEALASFLGAADSPQTPDPRGAPITPAPAVPASPRLLGRRPDSFRDIPVPHPEDVAP